ncbi:uncharacterized protein LOC141700518 [Apium graveolens]|uniref:uncharacterized protein LOC141700518 n=1 Tax=Apium graveolens TaxID=4045 RepID=UPI003D7A69CE
MNLSHSTWPIVLVNYNLPPWLCMKQENLILSTLISGPDSPKNSIDVFMQPLIAELKELWEVGVNTYDALADEDFNLRARVLWTISDFPGYAMLSGWSTKGKLGCPVCHYETSSLYLKHSKKMCYMNHRKFLPSAHKWRMDTKRFNGVIEMGQCPSVLTGTDIEELLSGYVNQFGLQNKKAKSKTEGPFKKKSIFFYLPYWKHNPLRHNLDAMHIEKNVCDNILGTLLNISGKTKDHVAARKDLQEMGIRKPLHPVLSEDGAHHEIRAAIFDLSNKEKEIFVQCWKTLNCRTFAIKKTTKAEVAVPLMKLSACLRALWSKVIDLEELEKLETEIVEVLCQFEMIFPSAFFDIMVHLLVHLTREVRLGGPQHLRNMFPIERYLAKLKSYVRNRSKPEGSITEGYIAEECVTFCSRFLAADETTKNNMCSTVFERGPTQAEYHIGMRRNKDGTIIHLEDVDWKASHRYVLFNTGNKEVERLLEEHQALVDSHENTNRYRGHEDTRQNSGTGYEKSDRDSRCTTQNSGVYLTAQTTSFSSSRDENPIVGDVSYYGSIEDIIELDYWGLFTVVLFKCRCATSFYVEDPIEKNVHYVIKKLPREWCDNGNVDAHEDVNDTDLRETEFDGRKTRNIGLYHGGEFQRTSYSGGDCLTIYNVDADMWAYNDLMEEVKDLLKLNEIGGVYAKEGKHGG